jgi:hypothetical protein
LYDARIQIFSAVEAGPELAIRGAAPHRWLHEHAVRLALDFAERVAQSLEKILVGGDDGAVHVELDHGLGAADRDDLSGVFHVSNFLRCDVGGEFDDTERLAVLVEDRVVRRLDPDLLAALADALVFRRLELAGIETGPEFPIGGALALHRFHEHAVVLALDLAERVAQHLEEVLIRGNDRAVHVERDHRLRFLDRLHRRSRNGRAGAVAKLKHGLVFR